MGFRLLSVGEPRCTGQVSNAWWVSAPFRGRPSPKPSISQHSWSVHPANSLDRPRGDGGIHETQSRHNHLSLPGYSTGWPRRPPHRVWRTNCARQMHGLGIVREGLDIYGNGRQASCLEFSRNVSDRHVTHRSDRYQSARQAESAVIHHRKVSMLCDVG